MNEIKNNSNKNEQGHMKRRYEMKNYIKEG